MASKLEKPHGPRVITKSQSPAVAQREFKREAKRILDGWVHRRRLERAGLVSNDTPEDWAVRFTYRLVKSLVRKGQDEILNHLVEQIAQRHRGSVDISQKPYKQALLVMFWWNPELTGERLFERRRRAELSDAMEYAHRHGVQSKYLTVFIRASGIRLIRQKLAANAWEPGFGPPIDTSMLKKAR